MKKLKFKNDKNQTNRTVWIASQIGLFALYQTSLAVVTIRRHSQCEGIPEVKRNNHQKFKTQSSYGARMG